MNKLHFLIGFHCVNIILQNWWRISKGGREKEEIGRRVKISPLF
jgi:hypothetical protein